MAEAVYWNEPYRRELEVRVTSSGRDERGPFVCLDRTLLYPEGGGQPADHGRLGDIRVVDVQRRDGELRHYLASADDLAVEEATTVTLDWRRRYDHMQQHTAQHLLTAIAADRFGWPTTSFHLGSERCDVELDVAEISDVDRAALEEAVAAEVRAARTVAQRWVSREELEALGDGVRSRGLPEELSGPIRLIEILGVDRTTCGGTHVASTAELEAVKLLDTERLRGGTRLHWVAGARTRGRLEQHERRAAELRRLLGASDDDLVEVVEKKLAQLEEARRARRASSEELAHHRAGELTAGDESLVTAHYVGAELSELQALGRRFLESAHPGLLLVTGGDEGEIPFLLAAGRGSCDAASLGAGVAERLEGRGGGRDGIYQGKGSRPCGRAAAVRWLEEQLAGEG